MRKIYSEGTANYPRLKTDKFFADYSNTYKYTGCADEALTFAERSQLLDAEMWQRFVYQFRSDADSADAAWRGEYWGKMMRGACFVYSYTQSEELYTVLTETVNDMLASADGLGRISTYSVAAEFDGWDMWCRKYVLLGMQYFLEICKDSEFKNKVISSMKTQVDYIMTKIGPAEEGKKPITSATRHWRGLNSSSILEPVVRLYSLTGEKRYLEFAEYIVDCGATDVVNVFKLAYEDELMPYQYAVTKAYEMTSCFEGLLEFHRITGTEWHKTAVINFANRILENDFTVIGCCGCTSEYFDHSTVRQANTTNEEIMQETCVTVTLMKFMYQLNLLTGDAKYADAFEISFYNAFLGSQNTENSIGRCALYERYPDIEKIPLPYDSYAPLTRGTRGNAIGGSCLMSDGHYYGCCACIASLGAGLVPKMHVLSTDDGFAMNMFINGTVSTFAPDGTGVTFVTETEYPRLSTVRITVEPERSCDFEIKIRVPDWSTQTAIRVNGEKIDARRGYNGISRTWKRGDVIELEFDMRTHAIYPIPYGSQILINKPIWGYNYMVTTFDKEDPRAKNHIALMRGPIMLAQDNRLGFDMTCPANIAIDENGFADVSLSDAAPYKNIVCATVKTKDGGYITLTDYSSAGKLYTPENTIAVWIFNS